MEKNYVFILCLVLGVVVLMELGRRLGGRYMAKDPGGARAGLGAVDGALFGLMGLLVAFTFSGAASRFDARRKTITDEANAIGTAWLRLDLLPPVVQPGIREDFRRYTDARIALFRNITDKEDRHALGDTLAALQASIWKVAAASCSTTEGRSLVVAVLSPINQMFDLATSRNMMARMHPPVVIYVMMGLVILACSLIAGFGMAGSRARSWIHIAGFSLILGATMYVIVEIEFPRQGSIRIDETDRVLIELRASMDSPAAANTPPDPAR
jgi:hypothetical protein